MREGTYSRHRNEGRRRGRRISVPVIHSGFPRTIYLLFPNHHAVGMFCYQLVIGSSQREHVTSSGVGHVTRSSHDYFVSLPIDGEIRRSKCGGHIGPNGLFADDGSRFRRKNCGVIRPECSRLFRVPGLYGSQPPCVGCANGGFHLSDIYGRLGRLRRGEHPSKVVASRSENAIQKFLSAIVARFFDRRASRRQARRVTQAGSYAGEEITGDELLTPPKKLKPPPT